MSYSFFTLVIVGAAVAAFFLAGCGFLGGSFFLAEDLGGVFLLSAGFLAVISCFFVFGLSSLGAVFDVGKRAVD